ncbi:hypothetical protein [Actinomadura miaoliensis]|uniref:Flp family type IVb pilin n=1 Tax=Actinomadura miaoliensis TaxID=430685 RepID=A0ABP7WZW1_9ACTN
MRLPDPPPELNYFLARVESLRHQARDRGGVTLEWMVVAGALFLAAVAAAAKVVSAINQHASKIK